MMDWQTAKFNKIEEEGRIDINENPQHKDYKRIIIKGECAYIFSFSEPGPINYGIAGWFPIRTPYSSQNYCESIRWSESSEEVQYEKTLVNWYLLTEKPKTVVLHIREEK